MTEGMELRPDSRESGADDLGEQILEFMKGWPSDNPSPVRIANAIGRSPKEVIDEMARLRSRGDLAAVPKLLPLESRPSSTPPAAEHEPIRPPPSWDRSN